MSEDQQADPFQDLFSLEDRYFQEGHALGVADGARSGRIEGRIFGLEKGFDKFAAMGRLAGQAAVWEARLSKQPQAESKEASEAQSEAEAKVHVPSIPSNARLQKHVQTLSALTEADSLSTQNSEDAVSDFDDRFKRAEGKTKVIQSILGESNIATDTAPLAKRPQRKADSNMEDFTVPRTRG